MNTEIILKKYQFIEKIGQGSFGVVYKGIILKTQEIIAIKTETRICKPSFLKNETVILNYLNKEKCKGVPLVYWYGLHKIEGSEGIKCLIITFYQCSLTSIFRNIRDTENNSKDVLNHILFIFSQMIEIVEAIHERMVIHRDVKPENFMYSNKQIFLIDYGMADFFDPDLIDDNQKKNDYIIGTPNYVSVFVHSGMQPTRRDDLISLAYVFLFYYLFLKRETLEWTKPFIEFEKIDEPTNTIRSRKNIYIMDKKKQLYEAVRLSSSANIEDDIVFQKIKRFLILSHCEISYFL